MNKEVHKLDVKDSLNSNSRVVVVGAGIAGLTVAFYLNKFGFDVRVFEKSDRVGGMIKTSWRDNKYIVERGPNTYLSSSETIARLSREVSLEQQQVYNYSRERFVFWNGALRQIPTGPLSIFSTKLLSPRGKVRLLGEPFVRSKSPEGETLARFVTRRAGVEVLNSLVDPFVSGVWAGNPHELELRSTLPRLYELESQYGSVLKGASKERSTIGRHGMVSYKWGMGTLPARLEEILHRNIKLDTKVKDIVAQENGRLFVMLGEPIRRLDADAVVIASGPRPAAGILSSALPIASQVLAEIPFCPLVVVHTSFKKQEIGFTPRGFGMLVPRSTNIRMLGTIFSTALFGNRAPDDEEMLTTFIGGSTDKDIMNLDDDEILKEVRKGLHFTMGICVKPSFSEITRLDRAIPQYTVGHKQKIDVVCGEVGRIPGLFITGNYFSGISVSDTIGHARKIADQVRLYLHRPRA